MTTTVLLLKRFKLVHIGVAVVAATAVLPASSARATQTEAAKVPRPEYPVVTGNGERVRPQEPKPRYPLADTFRLHSRRHAKRVVYLDFNGAHIAGRVWNRDFNNGRPFDVGPFDFDLKPASVSDAELAIVQSIFDHFAEDFRPLDVDVTTEDPGEDAIRRDGVNDTRFGTRVVLTSYSKLEQQCECGGMAVPGSFNDPVNHTRRQPAFAFVAGAPGGGVPSAKIIADVVANVTGVALGLEPDGRGRDFYYGGHNVWAPLMGVAYFRPLTQFSRGDYRGATNTQDDFAVMERFGAPPVHDDVGDHPFSATYLPFGRSFSARGIIGTAEDNDVFAVRHWGGRLTLRLDVALRGANLDTKLELLAQNGAVLGADDPAVGQVFDPATAENVATGLGAGLSVVVPPGTYFARVQGVGFGNPNTNGYTDYGSVGEYTISGTIG